MKLDTVGYLIRTKQPEMRRFVVKFGLTPAKDENDLWVKSNYVIAKFKGEALKDIANIHPDKQLILWALGEGISKDAPKQISEKEIIVDTIVPKKEEKKSGACGCSGADGNEFSNCDGNTNCPCKEKKENSTSSCGCGDKKEKTSGADGKTLTDTLKDNMPLVIIGSLLLVGGLIFLGKRQSI